MISIEMFGSDIIRIKIKGYLKNNTENELLEFDVNGIKNKNKIVYSCDNVKYTVKISENEIILIREGSDFLNTFIFNSRKSKSNYLLKNINYDVDIDIVTLSFINMNNTICIKYRVLDTNCDYEYKIEMSDLL